MNPEHSTVHVVDDDAALRRALKFLLESVGWQVALHESAEAFLASLKALKEAGEPCHPACLLLDIRMPVMSGLELQRALREQGIDDAESLPILFMTGHGNVSMAVQALKLGACDFIEKPFKDQVLLDAVAAAMRRSVKALADARQKQAAQAPLETLSAREWEVAKLVAQGLPNKVTAAQLGISEKTVHIHRQRIMDKAGVSSAAELTRLMLKADPQALD